MPTKYFTMIISFQPAQYIVYRVGQLSKITYRNIKFEYRNALTNTELKPPALGCIYIEFLSVVGSATTSFYGKHDDIFQS